MLFEPAPRFDGLAENAFEAFDIRDRDRRRRTIVERFHPALERLGEDLVRQLNPKAINELHAHLPRLDWPPGYEPFCTWLALSREAHGYQAGPQLSVGVHRDEVSLRLGWDTAADGFGRFEFLCRHGPRGRELQQLAAAHGLSFRVFTAADWPQGSEVVFRSPSDLAGSFDEVRRRGSWWELGQSYPLPARRAFVCSPALGLEASRLFGLLLPVYDGIAGQHESKT